MVVQVDLILWGGGEVGRVGFRLHFIPQSKQFSSTFAATAACDGKLQLQHKTTHHNTHSFLMSAAQWHTAYTFYSYMKPLQWSIHRAECQCTKPSFVVLYFCIFVFLYFCSITVCTSLKCGGDPQKNNKNCKLNQCSRVVEWSGALPCRRPLKIFALMSN